jgi:hypothetical protein
MKIGKKFNTLTHGEYLHLLENYKKFIDFNHLGLFRSIVENHKLSAEQKIEIRNASIGNFPKFFAFLQVKDPWTFIKLKKLGQNLTVADERKLWEEIWFNQQRILANKRIKHRNFGVYSKHSCGYDVCNLNGLMIKQGSLLAEYDMGVRHHRYSTVSKSELYKRERKEQRRVVQQDLANEAA